MWDLNTIRRQNEGKASKLIREAQKTGGVSFNNRMEKLTLKDGYTVSIEKILETTDQEKLECCLNRELKKHVGSCFYGIWLKDGVFYLDGNINVSGKKLAIELGKLHEQRAIYDETKKEVITL